jgi:hypothetical protein
MISRVWPFKIIIPSRAVSNRHLKRLSDAHKTPREFCFGAPGLRTASIARPDVLLFITCPGWTGHEQGYKSRANPRDTPNGYIALSGRISTEQMHKSLLRPLKFFNAEEQRPQRLAERNLLSSPLRVPLRLVGSNFGCGSAARCPLYRRFTECGDEDVPAPAGLYWIA